LQQDHPSGLVETAAAARIPAYALAQIDEIVVDLKKCSGKTAPTRSMEAGLVTARSLSEHAPMEIQLAGQLGNVCATVGTGSRQIQAITPANPVVNR
jgi:hypothetical protein